MAGITAIHGVDDTLKTIAKAAVTSLDKVPTVTVGPLKGADTLSVNWFLYRISPNPAYRNMEPPRTGWRTARGKPPLALQLHYLLTAFPGGGTTDGDHEQFSHGALAAVMNALHENAIVGEQDPALSEQAKPLVEPLRITLEPLDLEALSKLWTAAGEPLRLSVGYEVSLVTVDPEETYAAGPPVLAPRAIVASMGPRLLSVSPGRTTAADELSVEVENATVAAAYTLAPVDGDPPLPAGASAWTLAVLRSDGPTTVVLRLPGADLAPGARRLDVTETEGAIATGRDSIGLTIVPAITGPAGTVAPGDTVTLATEHAAADVEVFLGGRPLPAASVAFVSAQSVRIVVPADATVGPALLSLRAAKVAGPVFSGLEIGA